MFDAQHKWSENGKIAKMEEDSIKEMFAGSKYGVNNGLTEVRMAKIINIEQGQDRKSSKFV